MEKRNATSYTKIRGMKALGTATGRHSSHHYINKYLQQSIASIGPFKADKKVASEAIVTMGDASGFPTTPSDDSLDYDVLIIGAGLSGIYSTYKMRQYGLRTRVLEAGSGVGGTWFW